VLYHADLRSKHVQVDRDGGVLGYLDWGTTEVDGLPLFDLLHLLIHERKQEHHISPGEAWRAVRDRRDLRDHEIEALDSYARTLHLDTRVVAAIDAIYPVLVAAMAEKNWDFSRPRWLHKQFGI
jgi:aminoglycoside phosphotransferase (APT) family kinase protein